LWRARSNGPGRRASMRPRNRPRPGKSPPAGGWLVPGLSVALGVLLAVPVALRGDLGLAAALLAVMVGYAVVLVVLSRRFEAADLLRGAAVDEHQHSVHVRAASFCGYAMATRSEEHTSELQSRENLVCRLLLEKKNKT